MNLDTFTLREGVVCVDVEDGTSRLLDFGNRFYGLSAVATRMLQATLDIGPSAAAERLAQECDVSFDYIYGELTTFLDGLERKHLIQRVENQNGVFRLQKLIAHIVVVPLLGAIRLIPGKRIKSWLLLILAYLSCHLLGWMYTVEAWQTGCPCVKRPVSDSESTMGEIDEVVRSVAASYPMSVECKERALTTWALGRLTGISVELIVGVHPFPLEGHCWCSYNGIVYSDDSERCTQFKQVWSCS